MACLSRGLLVALRSCCLNNVRGGGSGGLSSLSYCLRIARRVTKGTDRWLLDSSRRSWSVEKKHIEFGVVPKISLATRRIETLAAKQEGPKKRASKREKNTPSYNFKPPAHNSRGDRSVRSEDKELKPRQEQEKRKSSPNRRTRATTPAASASNAQRRKKESEEGSSCATTNSSPPPPPQPSKKNSQTCRPQLLGKPQRGRNRRLDKSHRQSGMPHTVGAPPPTVARQGREQQKYGDDGSRLVAGCIPVRYVKGNNGFEGARVCLVSSRGGKGFVFPKGGWETDESVESAALRETVEEAGLRGVLEPLVGQFEFSSGKAGRARCVAFMFSMVVREELEVWPEMKQRERKWCTIEEAYSLARMQWMKAALKAWVESKGWKKDLDKLLENARNASSRKEDPKDPCVGNENTSTIRSNDDVITAINFSKASDRYVGKDKDSITVKN